MQAATRASTNAEPGFTFRTGLRGLLGPAWLVASGEEVVESTPDRPASAAGAGAAGAAGVAGVADVADVAGVAGG
jgi:hypothetical protein